MAPTATDPRQLLVVLNLARRKALYKLAAEITARMRSQLELDAGAGSGAGSGAGAGVNETAFGVDVDVEDEEGWSDDDTLCEGEGGGRKAAEGGKKKGLPSRKVVLLREAALEHFDKWRGDFLKKLRDVVGAQEDARVLEERRKRLEVLAGRKSKAESRYRPADLISFGDDEPGDASRGGGKSEVSALQRFYPPVETRMTTVSFEDRQEIVSCVLLLLLSTGSYSAHARVFALHLVSSLELPLGVLVDEEKEIAHTLLEASAEAGKQGSGATMSADAEAEKRRQEGQKSRFWKVGLASVAGAAVIGITGGLAAPVVAGAIGGLMGSVGLGGVASFLGIFWMNGALVGTLFGAMGAKMTGEMMDNYAKEVEDFRFIPLNDLKPSPTSTSTSASASASTRRLRVTIGINGWLTSHNDVTTPWRCLSDESEVFALRYEMDRLLALGTALEGLVSTYAWRAVKMEILRRTVLASLWAALWPAYILSMAAKIDNPFNLARNRSEKAGRVLADALVNKVQGERPVTLVGYSLGARAIYSCLRSLADRRAFGLVDSVVLIGAPAPSDTPRWDLLRSVVAGPVFNVYSQNDYILAFLYRTHSLEFGIAGLQPLEHVRGVHNLDLSDQVSGHLRYPALTGQILARCGFPGVEGGEGPIEREEDLRAAEVDTGSQVGELIELGELEGEGEVGPVEPKTLGSARPRYEDDLRALSGESLLREPALVGRKTDRERVVVSRTGGASVEADPLGSLADEGMACLSVEGQRGEEQTKGKGKDKALPSSVFSADTRPVIESRSKSAPGAVEPKSLVHPGLSFIHPEPISEHQSKSTGNLSENMCGWGADDDMYEDEDSGGISMVDNDAK